MQRCCLASAPYLQLTSGPNYMIAVTNAMAALTSQVGPVRLLRVRGRVARTDAVVVVHRPVPSHPHPNSELPSKCIWKGTRSGYPFLSVFLGSLVSRTP